MQPKIEGDAKVTPNPSLLRPPHSCRQCSSAMDRPGTLCSGCFDELKANKEALDREREELRAQILPMPPLLESYGGGTLSERANDYWDDVSERELPYMIQSLHTDILRLRTRIDGIVKGRENQLTPGFFTELCARLDEVEARLLRAPGTSEVDTSPTTEG